MWITKSKPARCQKKLKKDLDTRRGRHNFDPNEPDAKAIFRLPPSIKKHIPIVGEKVCRYSMHPRSLPDDVVMQEARASQRECGGTVEAQSSQVRRRNPGRLRTAGRSDTERGESRLGRALVSKIGPDDQRRFCEH